MLYCGKCDGNNEKSTRFCIHCGAEIISKEDYYGRKDFFEAERRSRLGGRVLLIVLIEFLIILGLGLLLGFLESSGGFSEEIEIVVGLVALVSPFLVIPCINSLSRRKYDSAMNRYTYLYGMGVDKSEILRPDAAGKSPKAESVKGEAATGKTSGFKGDLHGKKPIAAKVSKVRTVHPIYKSVTRMESKWKCVVCDTENNTTERSCIVCDMSR